MDNNVLAHYGVLGQKWGIRRYQNKDDSLTNTGKSRDRKKEQQVSENNKKADVRYRGTLTNDQLREKINRLKMEKELRELTGEEINRGETAVKKILGQVGTKVATTALTGATLYAIKSAIDKNFDRKEFASAVYNGGKK